MSVLDYVLNGLEAELALERELGVRSIPCDRALLNVEPAKSDEGANATRPVLRAPQPAPTPRAPQPAPTPRTPQPAPSAKVVFLHDRALSEGGVAMMAKIVTAMGFTSETAPIVVAGELPVAKAYVVLGSNALKKWFPGAHASPGQWLADGRLPNVLVTYSPEYILRFGAVTPAVRAIKSSVWTSLKGLLTRFMQIG